MFLSPRNDVLTFFQFECALGRTVLQVLFHGSDIIAVDQDHQVWRQPVERL